jgi:hypothetical protein
LGATSQLRTQGVEWLLSFAENIALSARLMSAHSNEAAADDESTRLKEFDQR